MSPFVMYLITRVDVVITASEILSVIVGIVAAVMTVVHVCVAADKDVDKQTLSVVAKVYSLTLVVFFAALAALVLTPSRKDMLLIYGVPALVRSRAVQTDLPEIYRKLVEACNDKLDSIIEDKEDKEKQE